MSADNGHDTNERGEERGEENRDNNGTHMFVEGLLEAHFQKPLERERRIARVLKAIDEPQSSFTRGWKRVVSRVGAHVAAAAIFVAVFIFIPRGVEASAQARAVVAAERQPRDRRVLFQMIPPTGRNNAQPLMGTLDIRDAKHLVLTLQQPNGFIEIRGRDGDHYWMIGPGKTLIDLPSDMPWPTWIQSPGGGLLVDMADAVEQGLNDEWKWSRVDANADGDRANAGVHLVATREQDKPAEPNKIDLRINPATGLATKIEMMWPDDHRQRGPEGGMNDDRPPHPPEGEAMRGDRPPPPSDGDTMDHDRPPPPPDGDNMGGDRPPPPPDGEMMNGDRPPPPPEGGMMDQGRPSRGMNGERPKDPKQTVPMEPPSKLILIVEPPITFDAAWFTPEKQMAMYGKETHGK